MTTLRRSLYIVWVVAIIGVNVWITHAQEKPAAPAVTQKAVQPEVKAPVAPVLTPEQRKDIQLALQAVQIAQLQLQALVKDITPPGYQLNEKLEFVAVPKKAPEK